MTAHLSPPHSPTHVRHHGRPPLSPRTSPYAMPPLPTRTQHNHNKKPHQQQQPSSRQHDKTYLKTQRRVLPYPNPNDELSRNFRAAARGSKFATQTFRAQYKAAFARLRLSLKALEWEDVHPRLWLGQDSGDVHELSVMEQWQRLASLYRQYRTFHQVIQNDAACSIQTLWRGHEVRTAKRLGASNVATATTAAMTKICDTDCNATVTRPPFFLTPLEIGVSGQDDWHDLGNQRKKILEIDTGIPATRVVLRAEQAHLERQVHHHLRQSGGSATELLCLQQRCIAIQRQLAVMSLEEEEEEDGDEKEGHGDLCHKNKGNETCAIL